VQRLADNATFNNGHTTWSNSANKVPFSNKCLCATACIYDTQLEDPMSNDTITVEHTAVKDHSQVPRNKSPKMFRQNIRGLCNKLNEVYCQLHHDLPHILCLSERHLSESDLQLIHLTNYSLEASYCRKTFLKGSVSMFVYRNLKYNTINTDKYNTHKYNTHKYNTHKDTEVCAIQLGTTFNKLRILTIYRSPRGNMTNFLHRIYLILQKRYNNKYNIVIRGDVNVNNRKEPTYCCITLL